MPTKQGADALAWVIVFIPLAGVLLELALARPGGLWLVVFAANVGFCYRDEIELRKAGYETKGMGAVSFFIPAYLWKRSELLRQGKGYFVAWIVFHEMLHHVHRARRGPDGRRCVHTPEFLEHERRFYAFERAQRWENENLDLLLRS